MQTVLTIAGFDPSSGAGVTADLMVFAAHGLFGTSCITGLTVQSTVGVRATMAVSAEMVRATLDCLESDLPPAGIKIGMLTTAANVAAVADFLEGLRGEEARVPVVLDPVLRSSSGRELLDADGSGGDAERAAAAGGLGDAESGGAGGVDGSRGEAAGGYARGCAGAAGDGVGAECAGDGRASESAGRSAAGGRGRDVWLPGEQIVSRSTHGTGCAFSSALLSRLVLGDSAKDAAVMAKQYVAEAIRTAEPMGKGLGPLNLLWPLRDE